MNKEIMYTIYLEKALSLYVYFYIHTFSMCALDAVFRITFMIISDNNTEVYFFTPTQIDPTLPQETKCTITRQNYK